MKQLLILLLFTGLACFSLNAQNYYVVKVEGKVMLNDTELKTGDKLSRESILKFSSENDKIYLLSPGDGYFLLSPSEKKNNENEWAVALKNAIIPQNKYYKTATRGIANNFSSFDDFYDLMGFFRDDVLIIEKGIFRYNPENIPLDDDNYFDFKCLNGSAELNCDITEKEFTLSGDFDVADFEMYYFRDGKRDKVGVFTLKIVPEKQVADELLVFFREQDAGSSTKIYFEQILPYIAETYGNTNDKSIREIINKRLNIVLGVNE